MRVIRHVPGERFIEPIKLKSLAALYPEIFEDLPQLAPDLAKRRQHKAAHFAHVSDAELYLFRPKS